MDNKQYRCIVKAVIKNESGDVIVVKEGSDKWDLPGGGIEHGEPILAALRRELYEEISLQGAYSCELIGAETIQGTSPGIYYLFVIYEVKPETPYLPVVGVHSSHVEYRNPNDFLSYRDRSGQFIYKYGCDDTSANIDYSIG